MGLEECNMPGRKCHGNPECSLTQAISVIGGKWKPLIIMSLNRSSKRFGQLDAAIPQLSRKVLTTQLSEMQRDGLVDRIAFAESPPRVEYSLTDKGRELLPIFTDIAVWGKFLVKEYKKARV